MSAVVKKRCVAIYDFASTTKTDLVLRKGDLLDVIDVRSSRAALARTPPTRSLTPHTTPQDQLQWWIGINLTTNRQGYFPSTFCQVLGETLPPTPAPAPTPATTTTAPASGATAYAARSNSGDGSGSGDSGAAASSEAKKQMRIDIISEHLDDAFVAAWQFSAEQKGELTLEVGNLLVVLQRGDEWWKGFNVTRSKKGWFPATSVRPASAAEREALRETVEQLRSRRQRSGRKGEKPPVPTSTPPATLSSAGADGSPQMRRAATASLAMPTSGRGSPSAAASANATAIAAAGTVMRSPARVVAGGLSPLVAHRAPPAPPSAGGSSSSRSNSTGTPPAPLLFREPQPPVSSQRLVLADVPQFSTLCDDEDDDDGDAPVAASEDPYSFIPGTADDNPSAPETTSTLAGAAAGSPANFAERKVPATGAKSAMRSVDADEEYPVPLNELVLPQLAQTTAPRDSSSVYKPITPLAPPSSTKVNYHTLPGEEQMLAELQRQEEAKLAAAAAATAEAAAAAAAAPGAPVATSAAKPAELQKRSSEISQSTRAQIFQQLVNSEMSSKPWFDKSLSRELAIALLTGQPIGTFVVRPSTRPSCLALSHIEADGVTVGHGILHHWDGPERIGWSIETQPTTFATLDGLLSSLPLRHDDMILKRVSLEMVRIATGLPPADASAAGATTRAAAPVAAAATPAAALTNLPVAVPLASLPKPDAALAAGVYGADGGEQARLLSRSHSIQLKAMAETGAVQGGTNVTTGRRLQPIRAVSNELADLVPKQLLHHASKRALALLAKTPCAPLPPPMDGEQYRVAPWFHSDLTRQKAIDVLTGKPNGAFVVRPSTQFGCLSLSHVHPDGSVGHGMIHRWPKPGVADVRQGWSIENEPQTYGTLAQLLESLPLKHGLIDAELVTDEELAAIAAASAAPAPAPAPVALAAPAPTGSRVVSPRALPISGSQYVIQLASTTDLVARQLQTTKSVQNALLAQPSDRSGGAVELPPPMLPLSSMQGKFAGLYGECVSDYRGADLRFELPLRVGDRVTVTDATSAGWWYGRLLGSTRCGWFHCDAVHWFPETLDLFVQSIGYGLDVYRALLANNIATVRQLQATSDIFAASNQVPGLNGEQQQAILSMLTERNGDAPVHLPAPQAPPPAVLAVVPQPVPYSGADDFIALTARELGGLQTRLILCVAVPAAHAYWIDSFDSRDRVARLLADVYRRLPQPLEGLLDVFLLETVGEKRLEPSVPLAEYALRGMSQLVIRQRIH
jgi:hypothetical protein